MTYEEYWNRVSAPTWGYLDDCAPRVDFVASSHREYTAFLHTIVLQVQPNAIYHKWEGY